MYFTRLGLTFRWLDETNFRDCKDLRNKIFVKENMVYQDEITDEIHFSWFESLSLGKDYYFFIEKNKEKIGVINVKNVENGIGELGIFIGKEEYLNTEVSILAGLTLQDFSIEILKLLQPFTKVRATSKQVEQFNISLGFSLFDKNEVYLRYFLNPNTYLTDSRKTRHAASKLFVNQKDWDFEFIWEMHDKRKLKEHFDSLLTNKNGGTPTKITPLSD